MAPGGIQRERVVSQGSGVQAHLAANPCRPGHRDFVDGNNQGIAIPADRTRPDRELARLLAHRGATALDHAPALAARTVQGHIDGAVVEWIGRAGSARPGVIGRKYAADEGDHRQAVLAVVAQRVQIPPGVAVRPYRRVETQSASIASAAWCPDSAAIGSPGPGWTLPPARYSPGIRLRDPGRRNEACHPCEA